MTLKEAQEKLEGTGMTISVHRGVYCLYEQHGHFVEQDKSLEGIVRVALNRKGEAGNE